MQIWKNVFFVLFSLLSFSTFAQVDSYYTVHIGNFVNPKPLDFEKARHLGFIYTEKTGNTVAVRMGGYAQRERADEIAAAIRNTTGDFARVMPLNITGGQPVTMIQLGSEQANKPFSWKPYLAVGQLFFVLENGQVKILTGKYPDIETARANLANIRNNGFPSAFPKTVNNVLLHLAGEFELGGEKRPLIPLDFSKTEEKPAQKTQTLPQIEEKVVSKGKTNTSVPPVSQPQEEEPPVSFEMNSEKMKTPPPPPPPAASKPKEVTVPAASTTTAKAIPPTIRGDVKRNSAYVLQTILKENKKYSGSLDGFYGKGTKTAYLKMKKENRQIQKYRILSEYMSSVENGGFNDWEEIRILSAMARDISGRQVMSKNALSASQNTLNRLYTAPQKLSTIDAKAMNEWHEKLWKGMEGWALQDPMLENIRVGMKVVYYQSYVLLEDAFLKKGFSAPESKALALEALKAIVGYHLDRFV